MPPEAPPRPAHVPAPWRPHWRAGRPPYLIFVTCLVLTAIIVVGATSVFDADQLPIIGVLAVAGAVAAVALLTLPVQLLPVLTLIGFTLIPMRIVPHSGILNIFPVMALVMCVWVFRRVVLKQSGKPLPGDYVERTSYGLRYGVIAVAVLFLGWLAFSILRGGIGSTTVGWSVAITLSFLVPMLVPDARVEADLVRRAWIWLGGILGFFTVIELAMQGSPFVSAVYDALGLGSDASWSVYRAESLFGQPLFAASYFIVPSMLGIIGWLRGAKLRWAVLGALSLLGLVSTISRGAILAAAIALGVGVILALVTPGFRTPWRLLAITIAGVVAAIGLSNFAPLTERGDSLDARLSTEARVLGLSVAMRAAAYGDWLGTGPGTSGQTGRLFDDVIIENSSLQLLISIGVPGLFLFGLLLALLIFNALRHRDVAAAVAVLAYFLAISGYNSIDAVRQLHLLLGMLAILCLHAPLARPVDPFALALSSPAQHPWRKDT